MPPSSSALWPHSSLCDSCTPRFANPLEKSALGHVLLLNIHLPADHPQVIFDISCAITDGTKHTLLCRNECPEPTDKLMRVVQLLLCAMSLYQICMTAAITDLPYIEKVMR